MTFWRHLQVEVLSTRRGYLSVEGIFLGVAGDFQYRPRFSREDTSMLEGPVNDLFSWLNMEYKPLFTGPSLICYVNSWLGVSTDAEGRCRNDRWNEVELEPKRELAQGSDENKGLLVRIAKLVVPDESRTKD